MVRKAILNLIKKVSIPFGVFSTSFLFSFADNAKAETNWIFQKEGIVTKFVKNNTESDLGFFSIWSYIGKFIIKAIEWFKNLPENIMQLSVDLLTKLYELLMLVLQTPLFLFNNSFIKDSSSVFTGMSILIVIIFTLIELIKKMIMKDHTDFKNITKRWSIAVVGSGFAPFLFEQAFNLLNIASKAITKIGVSEVNSGVMMNYLKMNGFNTFLLIGFDIIILALMIPIFLQNGRRFFDLMCLSALTPLALSAWVFDDYKHYHTRWWTEIKSLASVQLVYSAFICFFGIFIFGTRGITDVSGIFLKFIISIGALYRFANPPQFIKSRLDNGEDVVSMGKNMWNTGKGVWNTVTFKPARLFFDKKNKAKENKIKELRKKHGRRYVNNLI